MTPQCWHVYRATVHRLTGDLLHTYSRVPAWSPVRVECESVNAPMRVRVNSFGVTSGGVRGKSQDEDQEAGAEKFPFITSV